MFAFPPRSTEDRRAAIRDHIDREKGGRDGLISQTGGTGPERRGRSNFVNRFSVAGRSYKSFRNCSASSACSRQLLDIHVTGPDGKLVSLATIATLRDSSRRAH